MFKNASIFRIALGFTLPQMDLLEEALQTHHFIPCGPTQPESSGWVAPRGNKSTVLAEAVGRQLILRLRTDRRQVPASAVKEAVEARIEKYKQETGRERVASKLKKEFKEDALQELLPRAFTKASSVTLWLDMDNRTLAVDTASLAGADRIVTYLVEVLSELPPVTGAVGIQVRPVQTAMSPVAAMSHWLASREAPYSFTVDRDCELRMPDDQKSTVRYSHHTLEIDEVAQHIAEGKLPVEVALTWKDRVSFVLTETGQLKKIQLLDVVLEGANTKGDEDGFDADAAIITGELSALFPDLLGALGGEMVPEAATVAA